MKEEGRGLIKVGEMCREGGKGRKRERCEGRGKQSLWRGCWAGSHTNGLALHLVGFSAICTCCEIILHPCVGSTSFSLSLTLLAPELEYQYFISLPEWDYS